MFWKKLIQPQTTQSLTLCGLLHWPTAHLVIILDHVMQWYVKECFLWYLLHLHSNLKQGWETTNLVNMESFTVPYPHITCEQCTSALPKSNNSCTHAQMKIIIKCPKVIQLTHMLLENDKHWKRSMVDNRT